MKAALDGTMEVMSPNKTNITHHNVLIIDSIGILSRLCWYVNQTLLINPYKYLRGYMLINSGKPTARI